MKKNKIVLKIIMGKCMDIDQIVELHMKNLEHCNLNLLGKRIVKRFYKMAIAKKLGEIIMVVDDEKIIGFTLITKNEKKLFNESLLGNIPDIVYFFFNVKWLNFIRLIIKRLFYERVKEKNVPLLVYIVIDKKFRKRGLGKKLFNESEKYFKKEKIFYYELDVNANNLVAYNLYKSLGFVTISKYSINGIVRYRMLKKLYE